MSGDDSHVESDTDSSADSPARVRVRGIYATALTHLLEASEETTVVQASPPIRERFDASLPADPADASAWTADDRQGVGVAGTPGSVRTVARRVKSVSRDALAWRDPTPRGAVYAGEVTETLGSGAVVALTDATEARADDPSSETTLPVAARDPEGFLPYPSTARHVTEGDRLRVQVTEPSAPWTGGRPVLDTTFTVDSALLTLVRGRNPGGNGPELADLLSTDAPDGWAPDWAPAADDADLDALGAALERASTRADALDSAFDDAEPPEEVAPACYWPGEGTVWLRFGRETRFGLDDERRAVTATMAGHHRVKAGTEQASAAVDFVEAVCPGVTADETDFPFDATTRQFGPTEGDSLWIEHGKPDGRSFSLGRGEVTRRDPDGTVVLEREMSGRGTYDALGVEQQPGDVAVTKLTEGEWWYPTVYRGEDGEKRGTYVNVCTPVEVFPDAVRYVDLHVDVVKHTDGTVERVDDDELDEAEAAGHVPPALVERAREVASAVESAL
ncbi:MAG: DUF402 domain-containing protein [Haloarculaceae archaeon]